MNQVTIKSPEYVIALDTSAVRRLSFVAGYNETLQVVVTPDLLAKLDKDVAVQSRFRDEAFAKLDALTAKHARGERSRALAGEIRTAQASAKDYESLYVQALDLKLAVAGPEGRQHETGSIDLFPTTRGRQARLYWSYCANGTEIYAFVDGVLNGAWATSLVTGWWRTDGLADVVFKARQAYLDAARGLQPRAVCTYAADTAQA